MPGRLPLLLLMVLVLGLALYVFVLNRKPPLERGMGMLVSAFSEVRVIEPRLTGGFEWGRYDESAANPSGEDFEEARELIESHALGNDSTEALHIYARLLAIEGNLNEAAVRLRKVLTAEPRNAEAMNDLGVCLFRQDKLEDALEQFEKVLEIIPESREAAFNRALCFQRLLLTIAAIEGFNRVAELEGDSGWAKEARVRIEELSRPLNARLSEGAIREAFDAALAGGNVEEARRISDENFEVLTKYALLDLTIDHLNAAISGDSHKSETALGKIEAIGRFFVEIKEDRFIADLAEYHRKLPEKERPAELRLINDYQEAVAATRSHIANEKQAAFDRLSRLASVFRARGNPVRAERAEIRVAVFHYESNKLRTSLEVIARVLPLVEQNDWKFEQAWVFGHIALVQAKLGRDSQALKYCDRAIAITERMREMAQVAKHLQTLSMTYRRLGDLDRALDNYRKSLRLILSKSPQPAEIAFNYFDIANIYRKQRNHKLALLYAEQALINCDRSKDANRFAQVTTLQALEQAALQHTVQARLSLSRALEIIPDLDPGKRAFTEPLILSQAGEIALVLGDIQEAIDYFTRAELLASKSEDNRFLLINSVSGRAAAYARRNQIERARSDVARMIDIIESYRAGIAERKYRSSFLESSQNAFDQAISLNLASFGNPVEAFNLSERARARALLDEITIQKLTPWDKGVSTPASPLDIANSLKLDKVQAALPEGLTMVKYSVSESQTYIFVVRRSGFDVRLSSATSETLDMLVRRYLAGLRSLAPMEQLKEQARDLYDHLIKPIKGTIPQNSNVCIVPDKALHFLPFAALVDESGDYLIRSYNLSYAPSASVLAHCFEREKNKPTDGRERIVAVGNPAFDRERYKDLSPLPEADVETSESAGYYQERVILRDRDATEQSVLAAMKQCDVAHLATHCLVEEKSPWLAALLFAKTKPPSEQPQFIEASPGDDGLLQLDELYNISLPRTRLVVLSACQSALGQYFRGEGMVSLVRPFLSSGVPTVVASLWPVHSKATASLMIDFHKHRRQSSKRTSEALRDAQMMMSSRGPFEHPFYWAPFVAIGSAN